MARGDADGWARLEPLPSAGEPEERACLRFFRAELDAMRARGLIPEASHATVAAEVAARLAAVEVREARRRAAHDPEGAVAWAEKARSSDPSCRDAWELELELRRDLRHDDAALALCAEAVARFPDFPVRPDDLEREIETRAADAADANVLADAREAIRTGDDARAVAACAAILEKKPGHLDATVLLAFARQRLGDLDEALALYRRLAAVDPRNPVWGKWVGTVEARIRARGAGGRGEPVAAGVEPAPAARSRPRVSWSSVAGEFVQDHWQKLILCLAVLLIVVSSNVGAYNLLGPRLWSPVGKCVLALVYSAMFAGLGAGLVRWGAERAGRILLLTTLIVTPANFMLVGQMKLLAEPTAGRLAVAALDGLAVLGLVRVVLGALRLPRGAWRLSGLLFVLSAFNAAAAPGMPWPWALQFGLFLAPTALLLAASAWLTTRFQSGEFAGRTEVTYGALGVLAFAAVVGTVRTGVYALELVPTLYALPAMATALACVGVASRSSRFDPEARHGAWLRMAGLVLSGLGFALALARPPGSALFSGNTLAAALAGLGLYAVLLRRERHPAYLYLGFGALFVAYFGAFFFAKDLVRSVEEAARQAMGYRKLPEPFRAINGLVFSPVLAALSVHFRRRWGDERLARHCHYLGVPFAVAACVFSGFEPKAAVICLSGYAALFALAVWVFAAPRVTYLAAGAVAGAAYFASTLWPGVGLAEQAFGGAGLGVAFWLAGAWLAARGVASSYRHPLDHAALGVSAFAIAGATLGALPPGPVPLGSAGTFLTVALLAALVNRDGPSPALGYLAAACGNLGFLLLVIHAGGRWRGGLEFPGVALAGAAAGLASVELGERLRRRAEANGGPYRASVYPLPLFHAAFAQVALALTLCGLHAGRVGPGLGGTDPVVMAGALALAAAAAAGLTRPYPVVALGHLALGCGLGAWVCLVGAATGPPAEAPTYAAAVSVYALLLLAAGEGWRAAAVRTRPVIDPDFAAPRPPGSRLFFAALPDFVVAAVIGSVALAASGLANGPALVFTLGAGAAAALGSTRWRPLPSRVDLAAALAASSALCATAWRVGWADAGVAGAWLALAGASLALAFWAAGRAASERPALALYVAPAFRAAGVLTWLVFVPALLGAMISPKGYRIGAGALAADAVALVLLAGTWKRPGPTYRAAISSTFAVYVVVLSVGTPRPDAGYVLGLVAVVLALVFTGFGFACRAGGVDGDRERVFAQPLFVSSLLLTTLAVAPAFDSPGTMALVGLSFLLYVKGLPSRHWLYPAVGAVACAAYFAVLVHWPPARLVTASVVIGYQLWLVGLMVRRAEPALRHWLRLPGRGYDAPLFHSALVSCLVAVLLRAGETVEGGLPLSDSAALALNLGVFCLLMVKAYPHAGWVHAAAALGSAAVGLGASPRVGAGVWWLPVGMAVANLWLLVSWALGEHGARLYARLGVPDAGYGGAVRLWSRAFFLVSAGGSAAVVLGAVAAALTGGDGWTVATDAGGWWALPLALGLGGGYVAAAWWRADRFGAVVGLHALGLLAVWWCAAAGSPAVARPGLDRADLLPLATAAYAAGTAGAGLRRAGRAGRGGRFPTGTGGADPGEGLDRYAARAGVVLSVLGALLTRGAPGPWTVAALGIAACGPGLAAWARRWVGAGYVAGVLGSSAAVYAALEGARRGGWSAWGDASVAAAAGALAAAAGLWAVAGLLRRGGPVAAPGGETALPAGTVALAFEQVALLAAVFAAGAVAASAAGDLPPGRAAASAAVGVLFGVALFGAGLVARWGAEWLVYASQSSLLGGYLYYRGAFPIPPAADAAVLILVGYLDLAVAEAMQRVGLERFARPTRYFSLALPVLPMALAAGGGGLGEARLFVLFAAASFYGVAGASMRWRPLGYAAAVLYNAFLWLLWSRIGWTVADHAPFFLTPVGLSAVLFAEVNRAALGRPAVNAVRGVGLSLVYLSLAFPIWETASLGAWVTLLLVSLAGVFVGIGLRAQVFLWLGLTGFVLDVVYQLGRMGMENSLAKWGIMLVLGLLLVLFVALNEKKRVVETMRGYLRDVRSWE